MVAPHHFQLFAEQGSVGENELNAVAERQEAFPRGTS